MDTVAATAMRSESRLADSDHPAVEKRAADLTLGIDAPQEKVERIFDYVRDGIRFGFPPRWDEVKASEVVRYGLAYCTTKATLFLALCRAADVTARVHFGLIDLRIMRGIFPSFALPLLPKAGAHSWVEVQLDGQWKPVDSYINDRAFYERAVERLKASGLELGYSVCSAKGDTSCDFNFGEKGFVHMGAVVEDHGVWDDPADYFASDKYPRLNAVQAVSYPVIAALANRNVAGIRASAG